MQPDEIYNLAPQSHVAVLFEEPEYTANSDALGALRILEAFAFSVWRRKAVFIRLPLPNFMVWYRKFRGKKRRHSIRAAPMRWQSPMPIGLR